MPTYPLAIYFHCMAGEYVGWVGTTNWQ